IYRKYKLQRASMGTLIPHASARYDRIESAEDLVPDPSLKVVGTVTTADGAPVEGAEVVLITERDTAVHSIYLMSIVEGQLRNKYQHVTARSDRAGKFSIYPSRDERFCVVAMHPDHGFALVTSEQFSRQGD